MMMGTKIALLRRKKQMCLRVFLFRLLGNNLEYAILVNSSKVLLVTFHCNLLMWLVHMIFRFRSQKLREEESKK